MCKVMPKKLPAVLDTSPWGMEKSRGNKHLWVQPAPDQQGHGAQGGGTGSPQDAEAEPKTCFL